MEQQQKKRDGPVRCVCEGRASEHRKSAEPEVVHGSVPARWTQIVHITKFTSQYRFEIVTKIVVKWQRL